MAGAATWTPQRPPADQRDGAAAQAQAGQSSSAPDQSLSAISAEGGENPGPACPPLPPAATSQIIAVMAQLTLHHARARARAASPGPAPSPFPDREPSRHEQ
jgi:hypothetical protein